MSHQSYFSFINYFKIIIIIYIESYSLFLFSRVKTYALRMGSGHGFGMNEAPYEGEKKTF